MLFQTLQQLPFEVAYIFIMGVLYVLRTQQATDMKIFWYSWVLLAPSNKKHWYFMTYALPKDWKFCQTTQHVSPHHFTCGCGQIQLSKCILFILQKIHTWRSCVLHYHQRLSEVNCTHSLHCNIFRHCLYIKNPYIQQCLLSVFQALLPCNHNCKVICPLLSCCLATN